MLKGCIVTLDALGCQTEVAEKIVACGGDYVLAVKDNPKNWSEALVEFFTTAEEFDFRAIEVQKRITDENDHGRLETHRAVWVCDVSWIDEPMRAHGKKLGGVGMIESAQWIKGKTTLERRYFIVSAGLKTVEQFANAVRAHWGVATMHWGLDVTFREEDCRVCKGDGDRTLSALRKFALSALRLDKRHPERRLRRRRKLADRPPDYRAELLGLRKIPASNLAI